MRSASISSAQLQILVARLEGFEVIRAIETGGAVRPAAVLGEFLHDVQVLRAALEHHVLEQVGHAAFAVALMPGADQIGHIYRNGGFGRIREHQETQAVIEAVFGNALDGGHLFHAIRQVLGGTQSGREEDGDSRQEAGQSRLRCHILMILALAAGSQPTCRQPNSFHSSRSSAKGLGNSARRAGIPVASGPTNTIATTTPANTNGSLGVAV